MRSGETHTVAATVARLQPDLVLLRRDLHRHPELAFAEERTAAIAAGRLMALGLTTRTQVGGTGVVADLHGERPGPTLLVRADMDALPITEATDLSFASEQTGVMHACGHDAHVAALIGAATVLTDLRAQLAGTIRFCFQPAEEQLAGAARMIDDGAMDGVDRVLGGHLLVTSRFGEVVAVPGPFLAGADFFTLTIIGRPGHGAMPHLSVDPVYVAAQVIGALQAIVARETRPGETLVVSVSAISGGHAANVTAEQVRLRGSLRWFSATQRQRALERIQQIASGICAGLRARCEFTIDASTPVTINAATETAIVEQAARDSGRATVANPGPLTASDDFAYLAALRPGVYFGIGAGGANSAPHHHPRFDIDERAIALMAEIYTRASLTILGSL